VAGANANRIGAAAERRDDVVTIAQADRPITLVATRDDDAIIAVATNNRSRSASRQESKIAVTSQDHLVVVSIADDDRIRRRIDD
jgi:hypothetical protein